MASEEFELGALDWGVGPFEVSAQREALRRQIVESPYDDALRTAYAELAIAEGDPRGQYVRLSLAREAASPERLRLIERRLVDLRARYGRAIYAEWFPSPLGRWLGRLIATGSGDERAGFISEVGMDHIEPATFSRFEGDELQILASLTPLESIDFNVPRPSLEGTRIVDLGPLDNDYLDREGSTNLRRISGTWSALPNVPLQSCRELRIRYTGEDPSFAAQIAEAMPELRDLGLNNVNSAGLRALGQLPKLERLTITFRRCDDLLEIFETPGSFPSLRALDIMVAERDPIAIARAVRSRKLAEFSIELNGDYTRFFEALDGAPLQRLSVYGSPDLMPEIPLAPLARAKLPKLQTLWLNELSADPELARLAEAPWAEHLETLCLDAMDISPELLEAFVEGSSFPALRKLSLKNNPLGDRGLRALASNPSLMRVEELVLSAHKLEESTTRNLLESLRRIESLDLGSIVMGYQPLAWFRELPNLATLRRYRASFVDGGATEALEALASSPHASELRDIGLPSLENVGAASLSAFIESPHLSMLGYFPVYKELPAAIMNRLLRRFGHRLGLYEGPRLGSLPEPDLDPWWSA